MLYQVVDRVSWGQFMAWVAKIVSYLSGHRQGLNSLSGKSDPVKVQIQYSYWT